MRRIVLGRVIATSVGLCLVCVEAACSRSSAKAGDSTGAIAAAKPDTAAAAKPLKPPPVQVDVDQIGTVSTSIQALANSNNYQPAPHTYTVYVVSKTSSCATTGAPLQFTAAVGSDTWDSTAYQKALNRGAVVGRIVNTSSTCDPKAIDLPAGKTAILVVAGDKAGKNTAGIYLYNVTDGKKVNGFHAWMHACEPTFATDFGDEFTAKPDNSTPANHTKLCDHKLPQVTAAGRPTDPPLDDWTLWFACGSDCCYADDNPIIRGRDSTTVDSSHKPAGQAPAQKPAAKPKSGDAN